jgi:hypothetical protein
MASQCMLRHTQERSPSAQFNAAAAHIQTLKRNQRGKKVESDLCASLVFILDRRDATSEKLRPLHVPR